MQLWNWLLDIAGVSKEPEPLTLLSVKRGGSAEPAPPLQRPVKRGRRPDEKRHFYIHACGAKHYQDGVQRCVVGEQIRLVREPNNPFSTTGTAIMPCRLNGQTLGHVPAEISIDLAPAIDAGQKVRAEVDWINQPDKEQRRTDGGQFGKKYGFWVKVRIGLLKDPA
jgi:hypothetical protein